MMVMLVIAIGAALAFWYSPLTNEDSVRVDIRSGQTLHGLAKQWQQEGWLPSALLLRVQARVYGFPSLRAGEFDIPSGLNGPKLLAHLATQSPITHRVSLIEGQFLREALATLANTPLLEQDVQPLTATNVAQLLNIEGSPEGWLYPDTYVYQRGDKVSTILRQAHTRMQQQLEQAWAARQPGLPYKTPYDALIMASLVEKETGAPYERPMIAGVFVRRLQKNMRLETDPTIIYGLGEAYNGKLRRVHLQDRSNRYNTYRHHGLPPTPIALAGRAALDAALNPADGAELFFVARGDGTHQFSATLAEHNKAVRQYQLKRRADYRSTLTPIPPSNKTEAP